MIRSMFLAQFHMSYALELIALGLGIAILVWSMQNNLPGKMLARIGGYIITILSAISLVWSIYYGFKFWEDSLSRPDLPILMSIPNAQPMDQNMPPMMHQMIQDKMRERMQMREKMNQQNKPVLPSAPAPQPAH